MSRRLLILYGTQTGNAKDVAERVAREAKRRLLEVELVFMDGYDKRKLPGERHVVFIASTTGQGETPDNMLRFWKFLRRKDLPSDSLASLSFSVFGLGDSGYPLYNAVARRLFQRLLNLGATPICERGLGDDQHKLGYDAELEIWLASFFAALDNLLPLPLGKSMVPEGALFPPHHTVVVEPAKAGVVPTEALLTYGEGGGSYQPVRCPLLVNQRISAADHSQDVRHLEFDISASGLSYEPGDVLVVHPHNSPEDVQAMLDIMQLGENDIIHSKGGWLPASMTARSLFEAYLDIGGTPRRYFFQVLSNFALDEVQKDKLEEFSLAEEQDNLYKYCTAEKRSFVEVLRDDFPSARPPLDRIIDMIPKLQPRLFSISSALQAHPGRAHVTLAVVNFTTPWKRERVGICSSYLSRLDPRSGEVFVALSVQKGSIRLPKDTSKPVIMVGPGTGIAPFRAMCQLRGATKQDQDADIDVYFGNRYEQKDFLYADEWKEMSSNGTINFRAAFSRDQPKKVYVQHRLLEDGARVWKLLHQDKGYFLLAGNAKKMPVDVRNALATIAKEHGGLNDAECKAFFAKMEREKRFSMETWA